MVKVRLNNVNKCKKRVKESGSSDVYLINEDEMEVCLETFDYPFNATDHIAICRHLHFSKGLADPA